MDLEEIKSQVARNRAYLGDRLKERGRTGAAVLEYRRALAETQDSVPVMNRLSSALIELGRNGIIETLRKLGKLVHEDKAEDQEDKDDGGNDQSRRDSGDPR